MTKEELKEEAEDYANRTRIKDKNTYVSFDDECISSLQDYEGNYMDISERIVKTYIDSAEPREKRIADFEKAYNETEELLDKQIEATYKLFEENKELKEKLKPENCLKLLAKEGYIKFSSDNLTKAKEIIEKLISQNRKEWIYSDVREEAEQFLKESE